MYKHHMTMICASLAYWDATFYSFLLVLKIEYENNSDEVRMPLSNIYCKKQKQYTIIHNRYYKKIMVLQWHRNCL